MPFQPKVSEIIYIDDKEYRFNLQPASMENAFAITGKRATFHRMQDEQGTLYALKVFSLAYCSPQIAAQAKQLAPLQSIPGLEACKRRVLIAANTSGEVAIHLVRLEESGYPLLRLGRSLILCSFASKIRGDATNTSPLTLNQE